MHGAYGRIDWMALHKTWKIIGYTKGRGRTIKEVEVGRCTDQTIAQNLLRNWYADNKMFVRFA